MLCSASALAQTNGVPSPCPSGNTPYSYFASTGLGYDQLAKSLSAQTGFGIKAGTCSNTFLVTMISTGVGSNNPSPGYASLSERLEYHVATSGIWEFLADGQIGVIQTSASSGSVTTAMFGGGAALSLDLGWWLSKHSFHLPVVFHADYVAVTSTQVKPSYLFDFRKTF